MPEEKNQYAPPTAPLGDGVGVEHPLERAVNALSDMDWAWWPVLRLRPSKRDVFPKRTVIIICSVFGPFTGLVCSIFPVLPSWERRDSDSLSVAIAVSFVFGLVFFVASFRYITVVAWNRRARRLRHASEGSR